MKAWKADNDHGDDEDPDQTCNTIQPVGQDQKAPFKQRLVAQLVRMYEMPSAAKLYLRHILGHILICDYPQAWPEFPQVAIGFLQQSPNVPNVYAGLICVLELTRTYRYKASLKHQQELGEIVRGIFPGVLQLAKQFTDEKDEQKLTAVFEMLYYILKSYRAAVAREMPDELRNMATLVEWGTVFLTVLTRPVPAVLLESTTEEERPRLPIYKCKKWAVKILSRLCTRYGNPADFGPKSSEKERAFAATFSTNIAPTIFNTYLGQIEGYIRKDIWLSDYVLYAITEFFARCVKTKAMWLLIKPHYQSLISHFIFPRLCYSEKDQELWEDDPQSYISANLDTYVSYASVDTQATSLLLNFAAKRRKTTLPFILEFINGVLARYDAAPPDSKPFAEKEAALRMVGTVSSVMTAKNSPVSGLMPTFFRQHVIPEFVSVAPFLRARACSMVHTIKDVQYDSRDSMLRVFICVLDCLEMTDLPVRVEAALAVKELIKHNDLRALMSSRATNVMQRLLALSNEIDVDFIGDVMETFVENFADELTPFAIDLVRSLRDNFLKHAQSIVEATKDVDLTTPNLQSIYKETDAKLITAMSIINTIGTLIMSVKATPEVIRQIEVDVYPMIECTFAHEITELYIDVLEMIGCFTYSNHTISPVMWKVFEVLYRSFKVSGIDYFEEMYDPLDNYISYGSDVLGTNQQYLGAMLDIIQTVFTSDRAGLDDQKRALYLVQALLLNLPNRLDQHLATFIDLAISAIDLKKPGLDIYRIPALEVILNALYYNGKAATQIIASRGWEGHLLSCCSNNHSRLSRVYDKTVAIVGIISLLGQPNNELPRSVASEFPSWMNTLLSIFETMPAAIKSKFILFLWENAR